MPCDRPYCATCAAMKQHQVQKPRKTASARKRERWIRRLKSTGRWIGSGTITDASCPMFPSSANKGKDKKQAGQHEDEK